MGRHLAEMGREWELTIVTKAVIDRSRLWLKGALNGRKLAREVKFGQKWAEMGKKWEFWH